jgi:hypothetical protein
VSTQPISDLMRDFLERVGTNWSFDPLRDPKWQPSREDYKALRDAAGAALVAVRAERDRLILAIRSHAPKQADAIIDVAAVSSPGEQDERANSHEQTINAWKPVSSPGEETP